MKILLTAHQFLPEHLAGTEILTYSTAREFKNMGHEVLVVTGSPAKKSFPDSARIEQYEYEGLQVVRFNHAHVAIGGQTNIMEAEYKSRFAATCFKKLICRFHPQIVHFFHLARLSASLIDVCRGEGIPMVFTATDFWFMCPMSQLRLSDNSPCAGPDRTGVNCLRHMVEQTQPPHVASRVRELPYFALAAIIAGCRMGIFGPWSYPRLVKALANRPNYLRSRLNMLDRVLVPTKLMEKMLVEYGLDPETIRFCPYGIDIPSHRESPGRRFESTKNALRVGFIGTLYDYKGAHILIEAVRRLKDEPIMLTIYGSLEEFPDYVAKLRELSGSDPRIRFLGTFPNSEIAGVIAEMDVLVVPSVWYENSPLVVYAAQAFKCPVIVADVGGLSEMVAHEENGLLFPMGDVGALATLLRRLIVEPGLIARLRERARPPKSIKQYGAELCAVYDELLATR